MELTERKRAVLKAVIKAYIDTGEPVGSKSLMLLLENAPSSATLRNEMSELCELGLLLKPHTSAGRIPTSKGYRLYVDSLMSDAPLNEASAKLVKETVGSPGLAPENIPAAAAKLISELTGLPAVACIVSEKTPVIKRVELLPIGSHSSMILLITDDGRTRSRIFRPGKDFTADAAQCFKELIKSSVKGRRVTEFTKAYMQTVSLKAGIYSLVLMPLLGALFEAANEVETSDTVLSGENRLYNICESDYEAGGILSLIRNKEPMISILAAAESQGGVVFGADTGYDVLRSHTVVSAKFRSGDKYKGYLGIIGQNRMSYEQIIPFIKYTADILTDSMTKAQKDMED